jgi:hypothetical protein
MKRSTFASSPTLLGGPPAALIPARKTRKKRSDQLLSLLAIAIFSTVILSWTLTSTPQRADAPVNPPSSDPHVQSFYAAAGKVEGNVTLFSRADQKCRRNAIVLLVQKKHATYARDSYGLLLKSLDLISKNYLSLNKHSDNVDIFLFHTGDFDTNDLEILEPRITSRTGMIKLVNLNASAYWSLPPWHKRDNQAHWERSDVFPVGYRHMCRYNQEAF